MRKIVIEWEGGSDFQEETMTRAMLATTASFQEHYLLAHKKNKIGITYFPELSTPEK